MAWALYFTVTSLSLLILVALLITIIDNGQVGVDAPFGKGARSLLLICWQHLNFHCCRAVVIYDRGKQLFWNETTSQYKSHWQ